MQHPVAIELGHLHITHNHIGPFQLGTLHTLFAVFGLDDLITRKLQDVGGGGPEELVVLYDENLLHSNGVFCSWDGPNPDLVGR